MANMVTCRDWHRLQVWGYWRKGHWWGRLAFHVATRERPHRSRKCGWCRLTPWRGPYWEA